MNGGTLSTGSEPSSCQYTSNNAFVKNEKRRMEEGEKERERGGGKEEGRGERRRGYYISNLRCTVS